MSFSKIDQHVAMSQTEPVVTQPNNTAVTVRRFIKEDAEFAGGLTVEAFRSKFEHAVGKSKIEAMKEVISKGNDSITDADQLFVACYDGQKAGIMQLKFHGQSSSDGFSMGYACQKLGCGAACGYICLGCFIDEGGIARDTCYLDHICVDSAFRGKGVGKVLMEFAESEARSKGCKRIYLAVAQDNRAKNLYQRQGYQVTEDMDAGCMGTCCVGISKFYKMTKIL